MNSIFSFSFKSFKLSLLFSLFIILFFPSTMFDSSTFIELSKLALFIFSSLFSFSLLSLLCCISKLFISFFEISLTLSFSSLTLETLLSFSSSLRLLSFSFLLFVTFISCNSFLFSFISLLYSFDSSFSFLSWVRVLVNASFINSETRK